MMRFYAEKKEPSKPKLNGKYCGNCRHWIDTWTTSKGNLPYYGTCELGRPFKQGEYFNRTVIVGESKTTYKAKYSSLKIRCDKGCKDWEE